jgi:glycerol-3-phosphate acyltransferase PlsY
MHINIIIALVGAYLVGSIPVGFIIARLHGIDDIRRYGTGVIGATNVARMLGVRYFFIVLLLDALKAYGYITVCSLSMMPRFDLLLCACALLLGNSYPIFLGGIGGKGVATLAGIMFALNPSLWIVAALTWIIAFVMTKTVGIASVIAAVLLPLQAMVLTDVYGFLFIVIVAGWIIWRHRTNIRLFYVVR